MTKSGMKRLFVALPLPESVRSGLGAVMDPELKGAKWVRSEQLHLTLRFIGDHPEAELETLKAALAKVSGSGFEARLAGLGTFGRPARVIWAGIVPADPVEALAARIESAVRCAGVPPEKRRFSAHVTLARLKQAPPIAVRDFLQRHQDLQTESFRGAAFGLYASKLSSTGAVYTEQARFPLT